MMMSAEFPFHLQPGCWRCRLHRSLWLMEALTLPPPRWKVCQYRLLGTRLASLFGCVVKSACFDRWFAVGLRVRGWRWIF